MHNNYKYQYCRSVTRTRTFKQICIKPVLSQAYFVSLVFWDPEHRVYAVQALWFFWKCFWKSTDLKVWRNTEAIAIFKIC